MAREFFKNLPNTTTPLSASRLNGLLDGDEAMGNIVVDTIETKNLFNNNTAEIKKFVNKTTGNISDSDDWSASDYIEVEPSTNYIYSGVTNSLSSVAGTVFYDSNKTFISGIDSVTYTFTTPSNAKYVRLSLNTETPTQVQFEKGTTATSYANFQGILNESNIINKDILVGTIATKNLFNIYGEINLSGNTGATEVGKNTISGNTLTSYIDGDSEHACGQKFTNLNGKTITFSAKVLSVGTGGNAALAIYDNNTVAKMILSPTTNVYISTTYTCTSNNIICGFFTTGGTGAQFTDIQVEFGNTRTNWATYQNLNIDVKQGAWTPIIENANVTYTRQQGTYYKIGKLVNLTFRLQGVINSVTSPGYAFISGVPFDAEQQAGSLNECANCFTNANSTPRLLRIVNRQLGIQDGSVGGISISIWEEGHGEFYLSGTITYISES